MSTISPISNSFNYSGYNVSNGSAPEGSSGIARNPGESEVSWQEIFARRVRDL